jgi:hypothetical protein
VFLVGHEEGSDGSRLVPLSISKAGSSENLPWLFSILLKGVVEEGCEGVTSLSLVLVVRFRFGRRGAMQRCRHSEVDLGVPPWYSKLAITDGLDVRKGEVLFVLQVVKDLVVRVTKGSVVGGFEGSQNDGPKYVIIPGQKASYLTDKKDSCSP